MVCTAEKLIAIDDFVTKSTEDIEGFLPSIERANDENSAWKRSFGSLNSGIKDCKDDIQYYQKLLLFLFLSTFWFSGRALERRRIKMTRRKKWFLFWNPNILILSPSSREWRGELRDRHIKRSERGLRNIHVGGMGAVFPDVAAALLPALALGNGFFFLSYYSQF